MRSYQLNSLLFVWLTDDSDRFQEKRIRRKGPLEDNLDEIAQYKLMIATFFLPVIWGFWVFLTLPIALFTGPGIVILMWL